MSEPVNLGGNALRPYRTDHGYRCDFRPRQVIHVGATHRVAQDSPILNMSLPEYLSEGRYGRISGRLGS